MKRIQQKQINDNDDSSNFQINLQTHDENILQQNNNPIIEDIPQCFERMLKNVDRISQRLDNINNNDESNEKQLSRDTIESINLNIDIN